MRCELPSKRWCIGLKRVIGSRRPEAYMLLGQIAEARCTQMVNPKFTYICKVDKRYLPGR